MIDIKFSVCVWAFFFLIFKMIKINLLIIMNIHNLNRLVNFMMKCLFSLNLHIFNIFMNNMSLNI